MNEKIKNNNFFQIEQNDINIFRKGSIYKEVIIKGSSKNLEITFMDDKGDSLEVRTYIENVEGGEKNEGETTELYKKAAELIQEEANKLGKDINYTFETELSQMAKWALSSGEDIFHWDWKSDNYTPEQIDENESIWIMAKKLFRPLNK